MASAQWLKFGHNTGSVIPSSIVVNPFSILFCIASLGAEARFS